MDYSESTNKRRKRRQRPHVVRLRNTIGVMVFRAVFAVLLIGGFAVAGAGIGVYLGILRNAPQIDISTDLRSTNSNSFIIDARTGEIIETLHGDENRQFALIGEMPQHLLDAFVAIEDERFHTHNGVDIRSMGRALHTNLTSDRVEGASTITQQLIKNMLGLHRNDLISKLQEQYLAIQFENALIERYGSREIAKEIILESYLNMINLGRNWHGVAVAARHYFGKDVSELTISESAVIAAITRNPSRYLPDRFPENNRYRQILVLDSMLRLEMITEWEHLMAVNDPVHDRVQSGHIAEMASGVVHSYFVDAVITQVVEDLVTQHNMMESQAFARVFGGGLRIYITQDSRIQRIVDDVFEDESVFPVELFEIDIEYLLSTRNEITGQVSNHRRTGTVRNMDQVGPWIEAVQNELLTANDIILDDRYVLMPQPQAAFVIMDQHNGHVLAISGGRGEKTGNRHFCRATRATRSPGSQFKVVAAFLPGIDRGLFSAAYTIVDEPWTFNDGHSPPYTPGNWWGSSWEGPTSVRRAIYRSANVVSAIAFQQVGADVAFDYLTNLGFTTLEGTLANGRTFRDTGASVPLGGLTLGVTQLELAAAYAAIANWGEYHRPVFYTRVLDSNGNVLLENGHNPRRVIRPPTAYLLTDMMRDTMRASGATGHMANFGNRSMPLAGKTGTSQNVEDLGFTGYTPYFTASVWLGFDRPRTLPRGNAHLTIWSTIMGRVHSELELEPRAFTRPDGVITGSICRVSNLLPTDSCRRAGTVVSDLFVVGSLPHTHCDGHRETWLCHISGLPVSDYCPHEFWIMGVAPASAEGQDQDQAHTCPYHGPHNMELFPPGGGFWGFPDIPGMPGMPGVGLPGDPGSSFPHIPETPWEPGVPWDQFPGNPLDPDFPLMPPGTVGDPQDDPPFMPFDPPELPGDNLPDMPPGTEPDSSLVDELDLPDNADDDFHGWF